MVMKQFIMCLKVNIINSISRMGSFSVLKRVEIAMSGILILVAKKMGFVWGSMGKMVKLKWDGLKMIKLMEII